MSGTRADAELARLELLAERKRLRRPAPAPVSSSPRYPLGPLLAIVGVSPWTLAATVRASGDTIRRALVEGLDERQADHWAVWAGHHPAEVWPGW